MCTSSLISLQCPILSDSGRSLTYSSLSMEEAKWWYTHSLIIRNGVKFWMFCFLISFIFFKCFVSYFSQRRVSIFNFSQIFLISKFFAKNNPCFQGFWGCCILRNWIQLFLFQRVNTSFKIWFSNACYCMHDMIWFFQSTLGRIWFLNQPFSLLFLP